MKLELVNVNTLTVHSGEWIAVVNGAAGVIALFRNISDAASFISCACPAGKLVGVRIPE